MKFKIEFDCDGAAFDEYPEDEIVRILGRISKSLKDGYLTGGRVMDINGNPIGQWSLSEDE